MYGVRLMTQLFICYPPNQVHLINHQMNLNFSTKNPNLSLSLSPYHQAPDSFPEAKRVFEPRLLLEDHCDPKPGASGGSCAWVGCHWLRTLVQSTGPMWMMGEITTVTCEWWSSKGVKQSAGQIQTWQWLKIRILFDDLRMRTQPGEMGYKTRKSRQVIPLDMIGLGVQFVTKNLWGSAFLGVGWSLTLLKENNMAGQRM